MSGAGEEKVDDEDKYEDEKQDEEEDEKEDCLLKSSRHDSELWE